MTLNARHYKKGIVLFLGKDCHSAVRWTLALASYFFCKGIANVFWIDQPAVTHSVSLESRKASSTALTRHSLQSGGTLGTGVSGGSSVSL